MPIYEYACRACDHEFERLQKFSDPPERVCPACEGEVYRKLSLNAFHLRGGGWYSDGYGAGQARPGNGGKPEGNGDGAAGAKAKDPGSGGGDTAKGSQGKTGDSSTASA